MLAYRAHYTSIFDYRTNHPDLPWTSSHKSVNLTTPASLASGKDFRWSEKNRHKTVVAWPRRPDSPSYKSDQETGVTGVDGAEDRNVRIQSVGAVRRGRTRQDLPDRRRARWWRDLTRAGRRMQSNTDENEVPVLERVRPAMSRRKRRNKNV